VHDVETIATVTAMSSSEGVRVVRGPITADQRSELERCAADGRSVVIVPEPADEHGHELAGVVVTEALPRGEWFVTLADRPESVRLDAEVPVVSALHTFRPTGDTEVAATTSVRYEHRPTVTVRRIGAGRVVAVGATDVDAVLRHGTLGTFVRRLLGSDGAAGRTSRPLGVAVVGYGPYGGMGYTHGLACAETDGLALVAAVDTSVERLKAAQVDFPDLVGYDSVGAAVADPDVDVAIVATPPVMHAALALELLRAGKHVVVEKPMCLSTAEADELMEAAAANDRTLTVHQSRRWDRDFLTLRRAVGGGLVGDVFVVETFVGGFEHPCRAWHSDADVSGGAVYDWGSHHVDWINLLYGGAPARVLCTTHARRWHDTTNVDHLSLWMQWDDGREASFRQSDVAAIRRPKFYVQGTDGTIEGHYRTVRTESVEPGRGYVEHHHHHAEAPVSLVVVRDEPGFGLVRSELAPAPHAGWAFHRNLADHLLLGEPLAVAPGESRDVVRVLEAATLSGSRGGVVVEL
jgi:predicted dehydrogenase